MSYNLDIVKDFQVVLFYTYTRNSIQNYSFVCTLLNGSKYGEGVLVV